MASEIHLSGNKDTGVATDQGTGGEGGAGRCLPTIAMGGFLRASTPPFLSFTQINLLVSFLIFLTTEFPQFVSSFYLLAV